MEERGRGAGSIWPIMAAEVKDGKVVGVWDFRLDLDPAEERARRGIGPGGRKEARALARRGAKQRERKAAEPGVRRGGARRPAPKSE